MISKKRFGLVQHNVWIYLMFCIFTTSEILQSVYHINKIMNVIRVLLVLMLLYNYVFVDKRNRFVNMVILWQLVYVLSAYINGRFNISLGFYFANAVGITLFMVEGLRRRKKKIICCGTNWFLFLLIANLLHLLFFKGIASTSGTVYLLGIRVNFTLYVFCGILFSVTNDFLFNNGKISIKTILTVVVGVMNLWMAKVVTGILGLFSMLICYWIISKRKNWPRWIYFIISAFLTVSIAILQSNFIGVFDGLLQFLGKDMTFSARTYIWEQAIQLIPRKVLLGHGTSDFYVNILGGVEHPAHNEVLNLLFRGGVAALICFLIILFILIRRNGDNSCREIINTSCLFSMTIMMIAEILSGQSCFYFLIGLIYMADISTSKSETKK